MQYLYFFWCFEELAILNGALFWNFASNFTRRKTQSSVQVAEGTQEYPGAFATLRGQHWNIVRFRVQSPVQTPPWRLRQNRRKSAAEPWNREKHWVDGSIGSNSTKYHPKRIHAACHHQSELSSPWLATCQESELVTSKSRDHVEIIKIDTSLYGCMTWQSEIKRSKHATERCQRKINATSTAAVTRISVTKSMGFNMGTDGTLGETECADLSKAIQESIPTSLQWDKPTRYWMHKSTASCSCHTHDTTWRNMTQHDKVLDETLTPMLANWSDRSG